MNDMQLDTIKQVETDRVVKNIILWGIGLKRIKNVNRVHVGTENDNPLWLRRKQTGSFEG